MISRRDFLKAAGLTLFAAHVPGMIAAPRLSAAGLNFEPLYGRVLRGTGGLWADSVIAITETLDAHYRTPHGLIEKCQLQPMLTPAAYQRDSTAPPFTAEVTGGSAVLRRYCAADAPSVLTIGHGGLLHVVDRMTYDGVDWYGVRLDADATIYWTHSAPIAPLTLPAPVRDLTLRLDRERRTLTAAQGDQPLFSVSYAGRVLARAGAYPLTGHTLTQTMPVDHHAAPFVTTFADQFHLYGAYWHNVFGESTAGEGIEVPPYVAKWLYAATQGGARVMIA